MKSRQSYMVNILELNGLGSTNKSFKKNFITLQQIKLLI